MSCINKMLLGISYVQMNTIYTNYNILQSYEGSELSIESPGAAVWGGDRVNKSLFLF